MKICWSDIAERFTGAECTLNGHRAIICGRTSRLATVARIGDRGEGRIENYQIAEFSWAAVAHIMAHGGEFKASN